MQSDVPAPDRTTLEAMTAYLKAHLVKTTAFRSGETFRALSETAVRFNDTRWFWTDDNAKAAELLCEPANYDADPAVADAALDFVLRMSQGAVIQRRGGPAELRVLSTDPAAFRVETAFFIVEGDLTRGIVRHALRFNDGRTTTAATHTGNSISFRHSGRDVTLDVEDAITSTAVTLEDRAIVLSFTSTLRSRSPLLRSRSENSLGALTYAYRIGADSPSVGLTVTLAPAVGIVLEEVALTTGLDRLGSVRGVRYRSLAVRSGGDRRLSRCAAGGRATLHAGPADYSAVVQEGGSPGFNYAMHVLHPDGDRLEAIVGTARGDRLQAVCSRYAIGTATRETTIREERMLTGGGYYDATDHYEAVMREATGGGEVDPTMSYDIGAELNAVAGHLLFARAGRYAHPPTPERLATLTAWYDRHIDRYFAFVRPGSSDDLTRVFTRGIAFVVLSLDCMLRATGAARYRAMLDTAVVLILRLARRSRRDGNRHGITFGDAWTRRGRFLDCQACCILALARAAWHGDPDGAISRAIHAGILGIRIYAGTVKLSPIRSESYEGLAVVLPRTWDTHVDTGFWVFKIGLVLRALHATRRAAEAGVIAMSGEQATRVAERIARGERQIGLCCRWHGAMLEMVTAQIATETNSETQPWVALGFVPVVDEAIEELWCDGAGRPARPGGEDADARLSAARPRW